MSENQLAMQQSKQVFELMLAKPYFLDTIFYEPSNEIASYNFILSCFNKDEKYQELGEDNNINFY